MRAESRRDGRNSGYIRWHWPGGVLSSLRAGRTGIPLNMAKTSLEIFEIFLSGLKTSETHGLACLDSGQSQDHFSHSCDFYHSGCNFDDRGCNSQPGTSNSVPRTCKFLPHGCNFDDGGSKSLPKTCNSLRAGSNEHRIGPPSTLNELHPPR